MNHEIKDIILDYIKGSEFTKVNEIREIFGLSINDIGEFLVDYNDEFYRFETNVSKTILYAYNKNNQMVYTEDYTGRVIEYIYGDTGRLELKIDSIDGPEYMDEIFN